MAFNKSMAFNSTAPNRTGSPADDSWKAQAFLNFYLPSKTGGRRKLGAIPLKDSVSGQTELMARIAADPAILTLLLSKMQLEYQLVGDEETSGFDI